MQYADIVNAVYALTNRPDRINETAQAISAATLRAHHSDFYYKDIVEVPLQFQTLAYLQQLPLSTLTNFRALKYLRKYYPGTSPANPPSQDQSPNNLPPLYGMYYDPGANLPDGRFFNILTPEETLDSYQINKIDIAYIAGQIIQMRSGDYFQNALCGYYAHPNVTQAGWNSWIGVEHPYAIVYAATAIVFKTIGFDEQNALYQQLWQDEINILQQSQIQAVGY
jgi:hypothetical protein